MFFDYHFKHLPCIFQTYNYILLSLITTFLIGCASKTQHQKLHYGLNSCFELESGEFKVNADKYSEKYFKDNCEVNGLQLAYNGIIRKSDDEYVFICMAIDKNIDLVKSIVNSDSTLTNTINLHDSLNISNVKEYSVTIGSRNGYRLYYLMYFDAQIKQPFIIIHSSKDKDYINNYFSTKYNISKRLNCEAN